MTKVVSLGAGRMGRGIAHVFAYAGYDVEIVDFKERPAGDSQALLTEARREIQENLDFLLSLNVLTEDEAATTLARVTGVSLRGAEDCLAEADYVFEGVPETLEAKKDAIGRVSEIMKPDGVLASTTSTILSTTLAEFSARPSHFLNAHFLNPAYLIPLVEVSPSDQTEETVTGRFIDLLKGIGKVPVRCKAAPGYIVPRLQSLVMSEACRMVEQGVATAEDIDNAVRSGFGLRFATMGPLEFVDWGGLDILYYANRYLSSELGERYQAPLIVDKMMAEGKLGLKTGRGMYDFSGMDLDAYRTEKLSTFVALLKHLDLMPKPARGKE
ncbi:MAG: 3-hydroxybutyryl-CoA dehydrogenase [Rhodospirillaceae bacterium TMED167]|nr:3-hydroxybutyryl-CoA dehydrogenase [Rhodospirillaceae bacterium]OUW31318.1 MAG: 3-hydroxybutyryl-CoA dehydrogenase [Rhodospirillaceae bacterium TMED167]